MRLLLRASRSLWLLCWASGALWAQNARPTLSGYVREQGSDEFLQGVNVYVPALRVGTASNAYGFYSLTLPPGTYEVTVSYVGYRPETRTLTLTDNQDWDIRLRADLSLEEVVIEGGTEPVSQSPQMSQINIPIKQIRDIPALLGEKDVLKVLQLMPGVQSGSEGNSGLYVRGGGPDQNLIILDDAVVYNAFHLFGFFSLFNGDALKSVELTKGGFPARYGGRLSSVVEMQMKDGNKEALHGEAGVGLIASRFVLEGPIVKNKSSFLVSARRTYLDVLTRPFMNQNFSVGYYFYDLNTKVNYELSRRDKLYVSGYFGRDRFYARERSGNGNAMGNQSSFNTGMQWGNGTATARWNHQYNARWFANTSLIFSRYDFEIFSEESYGTGLGSEPQAFSLRYRSGIRDWALKHDVDFIPNPQHHVRVGGISTLHRFTPSALVVRETGSPTTEQGITPIDGLESGLYVEDRWQPTERIAMNGGLRLSHFATQGRQYFLPEPRLSGAYRLRDDLSLKASYARMNQYLHLLSNTTVGLPTDLWVPATRRVGPQRAWQVATGIGKDFFAQNLALTVEAYYKKSDNILSYREGASFFFLDELDGGQQPQWEDNVTQGQSWSYGLEFLLQRRVGKLSGWLGYTLSWTQWQFDELNLGEKFFARYDRRHDISLVGIYHLSDRITLSGTWVYGTGNAITLPRGSFLAPEHDFAPPGLPPPNRFFGSPDRSYYGARNDFRMAPYHRLDFGVQFRKNIRWVGLLPAERTWELSVYNLYNRQNPFFYYIGSDFDPSSPTGQSPRTLKQISLFPFIPSISYQIKF